MGRDVKAPTRRPPLFQSTRDTLGGACRRGCVAGKVLVGAGSWARPCTWAAAEVLAIGEEDGTAYLYGFCIRHWVEIRRRLPAMLIGTTFREKGIVQ